MTAAGKTGLSGLGGLLGARMPWCDYGRVWFVPSGAKATYSYDARGLESSMTDALGHTIGFAYDAAGQQTVMTDANGKVWLTTYDLRLHLRCRVRHRRLALGNRTSVAGAGSEHSAP